MNFGVQYYRAPFPAPRYWEEDLREIRRSGFNTVQIWVSWGWVEATPDKFVYDDYDRLVELAAKNGLGVILSTIAEIQPNWIHRLIPGSEMIDHLGHKVISSGRCEHHFGLTPGGCTDHPAVWERMSRFLRETGLRYAGADNLRGWDIWNELRWNIQADNLVCFCPHTLQKFRLWLERRFGSLDGLNRAWRRRYDSWEDVMPGKLPDRPYTEMMAFEEFLTRRADEHARLRYETMRQVDKVHVITAHGSKPTVLCSGDPMTYPLDRGNDWRMAAELDGIGCSSFPRWWDIDDADFGIRIDMVKSAANGKKVWLSELQGGRASIGFDLFADVSADHQQRWIWNGLGSGADTILFWCWRDEVFGRESSGFGLSGRDGLASERLAAMKVSGDLLESQSELFDRYVPDRPEVGILFTPQSYYLGWAQEGWARRMELGITGYARALAKHSIPLVFIEAGGLEKLDELKVLFLPRAVVLDPEQEDALCRFVERGGTLVAESECGAFDSRGFYRYPEDRFLARFGITELGRRRISAPSVKVVYGGTDYRIGVSQWLTPPEGSAPGEISTVRRFGSGRVIYLGSYPGNASRETYCADFESLLKAIVKDAGVELPAEVLSPTPGDKEFVYLKSGVSGGGATLLFVFFPEGRKDATLSVSDRLFPGGRAVELLSGKAIGLAPSAGRRELTVAPGRFNLAVYTG